MTTCHSEEALVATEESRVMERIFIQRDSSLLTVAQNDIVNIEG